jgi:hypothetical protein
MTNIQLDKRMDGYRSSSPGRYTPRSDEERPRTSNWLSDETGNLASSPTGSRLGQGREAGVDVYGLDV